MAEVRLPCDSKLTVAELRQSFLFGIPISNADTGEDMPDEVLQRFIDISYEYLEYNYDIMVLPTRITDEHQDFYMDQAGRSYFSIDVNKVPVLWDPANRDKYKITVYAYYGAGIEQFEFPSEWLRVNPTTGSLHVYPTFGSMGSFLHQFQAMNFSIGTFRSEFIPQYYQMSYCAGFDPIPKYINSIIGKLSTIYLFNILGDILLGAGIASYSLSVDGLSQSISTTQSAMYAAYSARIEMYKKELEQELTLLKARFGSVQLAGM